MIDAVGTLQVGQRVVVREHRSFGVVVAVAPDGEPGQEVVEVGTDCVVLAEPATGTRTRIPWYLVSVEPGPQPPAAPSGQPVGQAPAPRAVPADGNGERGDEPAPGGQPPDAIPA
jgi:hypothetical protein